MGLRRLYAISLLLLCFVYYIQSESYRPTTIRIKANFSKDEEMFLKGGLDSDHMKCPQENDPPNICMIPIRHLIHTEVSKLFHHAPNRYDSYSVNDNYLDFFGPEKNQGEFEGLKALGTPMYWHSNITHGKNASHNKETHKDNKKETEKKSGFWVAEFQMDCDRAHGPQQWFEFKPIRRLHKTQVVNFDPVQFAPLVDTVSGVAYFSAWDGGNYWGQCGRINTVELGEAGTKVS